MNEGELPRARFLRALASAGRKQPLWGSVFVTRRCNRSCSYCAASSEDGRDIPAETWIGIAERLSSWGTAVVTIVGGEPTLRSDLEVIVAGFRACGMEVHLHSNCLALDSRRVERLAKAGLFALTGSIDSLGGFEKADTEHVFSTLESARSMGVIALVASLVTAVNIREVPLVARSAIERGFFFGFELYQHVGGLFSLDVADLIPSSDLVSDFMVAMRSMKIKTGAVRNTHRFMAPQSTGLYYHGWKCDPSRDDWIVVNNDGSLMPCQEFKTDLFAMDLAKLDDPRWVREKNKAVRECKGCYYHCYFEPQTSSKREVVCAAAAMLGHGACDWTAQFDSANIMD